MPTKEKRRSRRYAIAFLLGCDLSEITEYQAGRNRIPIYQGESGPEFLIALRDGEKPPDPDEYAWSVLGMSYGYRVMQSAE